MKITPLEIRQKTFEKSFRGVDREEVQAYLLSLSQEWERVLDENKEYKIKLEASQKEVEKLREVESSLFKTLKTAEDTGANMIDQAEKAANLHLKESQIQSEAILNDAKNKARDMIEESEMKTKQIVDEMEEQLKALGQAYRTLENHRDDLISNIKILSNEALDKVERASNQIKTFDLEELVLKAKNIVASLKVSEQTKPTSKTTPIQPVASNTVNPSVEPEKKIEKEEEENPPAKAKSSESFFDQFD